MYFESAPDMKILIQLEACWTQHLLLVLKQGDPTLAIVGPFRLALICAKYSIVKKITSQTNMRPGRR